MLREVACPTLVVRGAQSDMFAPETVPKMIEANTRFEVVSIEGGHHVAGDNPAGFVAAVRAFLATLAPLTALGWAASGHTGTVTSVATFDAGGAAQSVAATADGTVLSRVGGALAWVTLAATVSLTAGVELIEYLNYGADALPEAATAVVQAGVIA